MSAPAINQLAFGVEGNMLVGEKSFVDEFFPRKKSAQSHGTEWTIRGGLQQGRECP